MAGFFITGTDTGIGKTFVTVALIKALAAKGISVAGMKPVASGAELIDGKLRNEDALLIQQAMNRLVDYDLINPYCFAPPVSPHIAAQQAGVGIDLQVIKNGYQQLANEFDLVLVEGAGGWYAPLSDQINMADLGEALDLPVLLVAGIKLGCLNHTILTFNAIRNSSVKLAGWIANHCEARVNAASEQISYLEQRLSAPLFEMPQLDTGYNMDEQLRLTTSLQNLFDQTGFKL